MTDHDMTSQCTNGHKTKLVTIGIYYLVFTIQYFVCYVTKLFIRRIGRLNFFFVLRQRQFMAFCNMSRIEPVTVATIV